MKKNKLFNKAKNTQRRSNILRRDRALEVLRFDITAGEGPADMPVEYIPTARCSPAAEPAPGAAVQTSGEIDPLAKLRFEPVSIERTTLFVW